jgi:adenine phosphoribosyltransferase
MDLQAVRELIRDVPDFPKPGIVFKDIAPLLQNGAAWRAVIESMSATVASWQPDIVVGIESRGFLFAAPIAIQCGCGMGLIRKPGKLPHNVVRQEYALEYGTDAIEMHADAIQPGMRVAVLDDVLATGGTAAAAADLVAATGGEVVGFAFMIELGFINGRAKLGDRAPISSTFTY